MRYDGCAIFAQQNDVQSFRADIANSNMLLLSCGQVIILTLDVDLRNENLI